MKKTYVLDTNVLIQSPYALQSFEDNRIILPIAVLEELDKLKIEDGERGFNARHSIRYLEQLRLRGNLFKGVEIESGGTIRVEPNFAAVELPYGFKDEANDNRILKVCKGLINKGEGVTLVTKDILVRLKAQMMGIHAEDFTTEQSPTLEKQYTGRADVFAPDEKMSEFKKKDLILEDIYIYENESRKAFQPEYNQFLIIHSETNEKQTLLGRYDGEKIVPLKYHNNKPFGVKPKNVGQHFLQEALMTSADEAPLVIVKGTAGTAKTFYSLAVGLEKAFEEESKEYRKILITRSNVQFDSDIGFLPGDEQEKIAPLLRPIIDNLEILVESNDKERYNDEKELKGKIDLLFDRGIITAEAMNFIRGRSITHTYFIIDEAQNLTPKQVKGIVTRVGKGTKVILLGDPEQIDNPLLDEKTNGLSYASDRMKGSPLCYQLTMHSTECMRSELASDAAKRM